MSLPTLETLRPNFTMVSTDTMVMWFSYKTLIAFFVNGRRYVSENLWSTTTGKHLNDLEEDKKKRMVRKDFEDAYNILTLPSLRG